MVRLYVGGLQEDTTPEMVTGRFEQFGTVSSCELARNKPGCTTGTPGACRGFAYVELEPTSEQALHRCISIVSPSRPLVSVQVYRAFRSRICCGMHAMLCHAAWIIEAREVITACWLQQPTTRDAHRSTTAAAGEAGCCG